jgi:hypothetical protein
MGHDNNSANLQTTQKDSALLIVTGSTSKPRQHRSRASSSVIPN